jgi:trimeric autotransporter adhesin
MRRERFGANGIRSLRGKEKPMSQGVAGSGVFGACGVRRTAVAFAVGAFAWLGAVPALRAVVIPQSPDPQLAPRVKVDERLRLAPRVELVDRVRDEMSPRAVAAWDAFRARGRGPWQAYVNRGSGLVEIAEGAGEPWVPGRGNDLALHDVASFLNGQGRPDIAALEARARAFLPDVEAMLGSESRLLLRNEGSGPVSDYLWYLDFDVYTIDGLPIDNARVFFRVNHGNLVQFGADGLPPADVEAPPATLTADQALAVLADYVGGLVPGRDWLWDRGTELAVVVNRAPGNAPVAAGRGLGLARVWQFGFVREGRHETWRGRVDATTGEVLELRDTNQYAQITGGVWPNAWRVDNVKQEQVVSGWPFTKVSPLDAVSNSSGIYLWDGNTQTASHAGNPFISISDACGSSSLASDGSGNIAWGAIAAAATPGDCQTPGTGGAGNTASARQQSYHVNRIMEKGRTYLTSNAWLQSQVLANVNINSTCNAFWNGTSINFYRSGSGCGNTGEDIAIALHEWGHGLDSNDGNGGSLDNGTGETYGDFTAALQTRDSCIGWGFRLSNNKCGGYGNACTVCDGVRDIDWGRHVTKQPWTVANFTQTSCPNHQSYVGPCGNKEGHCESYVSSGALFDLAAYDLHGGCSTRSATYPDYNCPGGGGPYTAAGAWQVVDRLWYLSRPTANKAFTCNTGGTYTSNGCNAGSNWKTMRLADDDDGNLANGTPHSCVMAAAFGRHGIACTTDTAWDVCFTGCTPPVAPTLDPPAAGNNLLTLAWSGVSAPDVVDVYRNEVGCNAGFTKVANDVAGSGWVDGDVANGTTYYYQLVAHPPGGEACASVPSSCQSGTPAASPSAIYVPGSARLTAQPVNPDGDRFVDNCESGVVSFDVYNDGD